MARRSYSQYCAVARALDLTGDRWTLLMVRRSTPHAQMGMHFEQNQRLYVSVVWVSVARSGLLEFCETRAPT